MYVIAEQVDKGEGRLKLFFGTIEMSDKTYDLCTLRPNWNVSCPLHPGNTYTEGYVHIGT